MEVLRKKSYTRVLILFYCILFWLSGCQSYREQEKKMRDTPGRGKIYVSADETFKPIVDELVQVYEANKPGTQIVVQYKPEAECLKDMAVDSIRLIIATRGFSESEKMFIVDSFKLSPQKMRVARDAVAVIVNPQSEDSLFTMAELKEILTGKFRKDLIPVFDGVQATSTVRYIVDSVLKNDSITPNAVAARTSEGVIDYVAKNPGTIGFIGVSWIGNKEDSAQISFLKKVKMAHLESNDKPGVYILPLQINIYMRRYPLIRDLVYILKENYTGLGKGFADFLSGDIGQLIFKRAYLVPTQKNFIIRPIRVRE